MSDTKRPSVFDKDFKYYDSQHTDVRRTWRRYEKRLADEAKAREAARLEGAIKVRRIGG